MQVGILPVAPLPGSVKVARRPVKPLVLVRVQVWQPISGWNVSCRRPCSERGGRRCNSCYPDHFWKAGRYKLAAPVLKTGSVQVEVWAVPKPSATFNHQRKESNEVSSPFPKPVAVSQRLQSKSCNPNPPGGEVEVQLSTGALRVETRNYSL